MFTNTITSRMSNESVSIAKALNWKPLNEYSYCLTKESKYPMSYEAKAMSSKTDGSVYLTVFADKDTYTEEYLNGREIGGIFDGIEYQIEYHDEKGKKELNNAV